MRGSRKPCQLRQRRRQTITDEMGDIARSLVRIESESCLGDSRLVWLRIIATVLVGVVASSAQADSRIWNIKGAEARACTEENGGSCISLTCAARGDIYFRVNGSGVRGGQGTISVDGQPLGSGRFDGQQGFAGVNLNPSSNAPILAAISKGSVLQADVAGKSVRVGLSGSATAVQSIVSLCTGTPPPLMTTADKESLFERAEDEASVALNEEPVFSSFSIHRGLDVWGGDIRTGLTDPALRDISQDSCARLCLATEACGAFTFNAKDGKVCFLKTGSGTMMPYNGATTGVRAVAAKQPIAPPTRGPLPQVDDRVAWRDGETGVQHAQRVRDLSKSFGRSCTAERADLAKLAADFSFDGLEETARVGDPVRITWEGNTLEERIPVWFIGSSAGDVRFDGEGAMVLGPQAPNPFGIAVGAGETRALVSLWGRGAGQSGALVMHPLTAGRTDVSLRLVAYLRACEEEVVLNEQMVAVDIEPAPAALVIGTEAGRADLTHVLDLPRHQRRVEFSDTRFRLTALADGSEIIERDGSQLTLSPTGRFLLVDNSEVVDVVDGKSMGKVIAPQMWVAGDSFLIAHTAPWAKVDVLSTFGGRLLIEQQLTGPSCCGVDPTTTHFTIDLENAIITLRGAQGHSIGPIQGNPIAREMAQDAYGSDSNWVGLTQQILSYSLGPVAPITVRVGYSLPSSEPIGEPLLDIAIRKPEALSLEDIVIASLFRGDGTEATSAFERIGLEIASGELSRNLMKPLDISDYAERNTDTESQEIQNLEAVLADVGRPMGWDFDLLPEPRGNLHSTDCHHYLGSDEMDEAEITSQTVFGRDGAVRLPENILQLSVVGEGEGTLLIGRLECQSGATFGSLRGQSSVFVSEIRSGRQPQDIREGSILNYGYFGNNLKASFQDFPFFARKIGRTLLLATPNHGRAVIFDLDTHKVVWEWTDLPSGNLLEDAYLTADGAFMIQVNSDGGFFLHRARDGKTVLSGRIVDDEIAVWTANYRFDSTAEAATLIDLRFPGLEGQFSLDRFDAVLGFDNLVEAVLAEEDVPSKQVRIPPDLTGSIDLESGKIKAKARLDPERQAVELRLYQDGIFTDKREIPAGAETVEMTAERLAGMRHASLLAVDETGLASNPVTVDLGEEREGGIRRALAVGVDIYADENLPNLNYAKADADRFMQMIAALPGDVPSFEEPVFVGGRRATPSDVLNAIDAALAGLGKSDHLVLHFAGHGLRDEDGTFYFAMSGTDVEQLGTTALAWSDVSLRLSQTEARVTILIDACHAGAAGTVGFATNDGAIGSLSAIPSNLTILAASKGRQQSIEARSQGGGLFTVALERVLINDRTNYDKDANGRIEASELIDGLRNIVSTQSEGRQVPWMTKGRVVGDHAVF